MAKVKRSFIEYWEGSKAVSVIKQWTAKGRSVFVDQQEADRRAAICVDCPFNGEASDMLVKTSDWRAKKMAGDRVTEHHTELKNCDACSCPLRLTVWLDPAFLKSTKDRNRLLTRITKRQKETGNKIHPECWQLKIFQS